MKRIRTELSVEIDDVFVVRRLGRSVEGWCAGCGGAEVQAPGTSRSQVVGDTNGFAYRVKAGSAGDRGGIKTGDGFPDSTPRVRRGAIARGRPPMMLWEGDPGRRRAGAAVGRSARRPST